MDNVFKKSKPLESNFELQITALVDTLVIILLFLLKSVASESLEIEQAKQLSIPSVVNGMTTGKGQKLAINSDSVSWNDIKIIKLQNFNFEENQNTNLAIKNLENAMDESIKKESTENKKTLLLQADKNTPLQTLKEVLKIAKHHGFKDIRFVGAKVN